MLKDGAINCVSLLTSFQVAAAIGFLHSKQVRHNDINSKNLLVSILLISIILIISRFRMLIESNFVISGSVNSIRKIRPKVYPFVGMMSLMFDHSRLLLTVERFAGWPQRC